MFYYAEINSEYQVINKYCLSTESTNPNYILITEDLYTNGNDRGDIVGQFYNTLSGVIDKIDPEWDMGSTNWMRYKDSQMKLSTKLDNMDKATLLKADIDHIHDGYANADDLQVLEDTIATKANVDHSHSEYSLVGHSHTDYVTQISLDSAIETLESEIDGKANASHTHSDYATTSHNHDSSYSPLSHSHTISEIGAAASEHNHDSVYATITSLNELSSVVSGKANVANLNAHTSDTDIHISESEREYWNAKSDFSGSYNDLTNKPTIPSISGLATEDYVDDKVGAITVESIGALPNTTVIPTVPTNVSAFTNDAGYLTEHQSLDGFATETYVNAQIDAIDIPSALSDLTTDSTHRVVTDAEKATWNAKSNFSGNYNDLTNKPSIPSISGLATETYVDEAVNTKADSGHTHNDIYYTETEINNKLATKADSSHNHTGVYDVYGAGASALSSAQTYTDEAIDSLSETVATKADASTLSSHTGNTAVHITSAERSKLSGIAEGANNYVLPSAGTSLGGVKSGGDVTISSGVITVNDDSHNHVISNVDGLQSALDSKAASGHNHDGVYYTETEIDTLLEGKANSSHTHTISNITNLQSALDGKANASHGTHVSYSTTAPVMDGSASVGTASTVARSDHKHPTDTSRAAQTSLDSHTSNKSNPHGVTLAQLGLTATAAELNALDGITATVTELNYVKGATSNIQTQLNSKAASSHTHTIANITNLQSTLDGKAASSHTHKVANISDLTATATELNYMDGVTSNVQTQLDGKAALSHNHSASNITSGTLSSDRLSTVPISKGGTGATTAAGALTNLGITATASELNKLDGVTATTAELNYVDGVTSNIQTQLNGKAASSHGTHVTWATSAPKANGSAAVGTVARVAREDHIHPLQTTVSGNAGTATTISKRVKITSSQSANAGKYIKFGTITLSSGYSGFMGYLMFNPTEGSGGANGLLHLYIRNGADTTTTSCTMKWLTLNESKYEQTVFAVKVSNGVFDLYYKPINTWDTMEIIVVSGDNHNTLALANSATYVDSITATYTSSMGGQVNYANSAGSATTASTCTGNAGTATKLATARTISLTGDVSGSTSFDGSGNVSITATVADDSHNHTIANVDGLQTALNGKSATSHTHTAEALVAMAEALFGTNSAGGVEYSYGSGSGKNVLTEISNMPQGFHTIYAIAGTTGNPETTESYRYFIHKTSTTIGWIYAFGADGSIYSNYLAGANTYKGWRTIHDVKRKPLWSGIRYMTETHTITPTKKLSECEHGWMLLWSDYDPDTGTTNNTDFCTTMIPNRNWTGGTWNGASYYCDVPRYSAGTATDSESRVIKLLSVYDNKLVGNANNAAAPRNDVVLRAVYEF